MFSYHVLSSIGDSLLLSDKELLDEEQAVAVLSGIESLEVGETLTITITKMDLDQYDQAGYYEQYDPDQYPEVAKPMPPRAEIDIPILTNEDTDLEELADKIRELNLGLESKPLKDGTQQLGHYSLFVPTIVADEERKYSIDDPGRSIPVSHTPDILPTSCFKGEVTTRQPTGHTPADRSSSHDYSTNTYSPSYSSNGFNSSSNDNNCSSSSSDSSSSSSSDSSY